MPNILQLGTLIMNGKAIVPPERGASYRFGRLALNIVNTQDEKAIKWIVVGGKLMADRCLVRDISYFTIDTEILCNPHLGGPYITVGSCLDNDNSFKMGVWTRPRKIWLDGQEYILRLPQVGKCKNAPNEWDSALHDVGDSNSIWHWHGIYTWGSDRTDCNYGPNDTDCATWALRGYDSPWTWAEYWAEYSDGCGWRPVLEPVSEEPHPGLIGQEVAVWHGQQIIRGQLDSYTAYDLCLSHGQKAFVDDYGREVWYEHLPGLKIIVNRAKVAALQRR